MRAHNYIDRSGTKVNRWLIVSYSHTNKGRKPVYLCRCECGTEITKPVGTILQGISKSCGCQNAKNHLTHGYSKTRTYTIWQMIKNRCTNPKSTQWKWYGGRGIKVCKRWKDSFEDFLNDMGHPPSKKHSIDRFPDNNGNYEPGNCRWATATQQANNRRTLTKSTH